MNLFDRYLLRQMMGRFGAYLAVALLILLVERMLRVLDIVLNANGALGTVLKMLTFLVPHYMGLAIPVAFFLAVFVVFSHMSRDGELDAMHSAGTGLPRLVYPGLGMAAVVAVAAVVVFGYLQPMGRYAYRAAVHAVTTAPEFIFIQAGNFQNFEDTTVFADRFLADEQKFAPIFLFRQDQQGNTATITAQSGDLSIMKDGAGLVVQLHGGMQLYVKDKEATEGGGEPFKEGVFRFKDLRRIFPVKDSLVFRPRGDDERELTLTELWNALSAPPPGGPRSEIVTEIHDRVVRTLTILILPFLAIPLTLGGRRVRHGYGMATGILLLVLDNEFMQYGAIKAATGQLSPWIGLWGPALLLAGIAGLLFWRAAFRVNGSMRDPLSSLLAAIITTGVLGRRGAR